MKCVRNYKVKAAGRVKSHPKVHLYRTMMIVQIHNLLKCECKLVDDLQQL